MQDSSNTSPTPKPAVKSKTLKFNGGGILTALTIIAAVLGSDEFRHLLDQLPANQVALISAIVGVLAFGINAYLRSVTVTAIRWPWQKEESE